MFVTITYDNTGEIMMQRILADDEILDCDLYAQEVADAQDFTVALETGHCPPGCSDFTVELADEPQSSICWTTKSYFIAPE